ncbi:MULTISPECIES: MBL fold metallo-hydrolase [Rhizobium]|uniref:MBL fold metallo-hydrolase n=1 Tax=Rhizobium TaxID=379 RepID=UPI0035C93FA5
MGFIPDISRPLNSQFLARLPDPPTGTFSYVYDCGSEQSEAFNAERARYREQSGGSTDILFVSHLHADHINEI